MSEFISIRQSEYHAASSRSLFGCASDWRQLPIATEFICYCSSRDMSREIIFHGIHGAIGDRQYGSNQPKRTTIAGSPNVPALRPGAALMTFSSPASLSSALKMPL